MMNQTPVCTKCKWCSLSDDSVQRYGDEYLPTRMCYFGSEKIIVTDHMTDGQYTSGGILCGDRNGYGQCKDYEPGRSSVKQRYIVPRSICPRCSHHRMVNDTIRCFATIPRSKVHPVTGKTYNTGGECCRDKNRTGNCKDFT